MASRKKRNFLTLLFFDHRRFLCRIMTQFLYTDVPEYLLGKICLDIFEEPTTISDNPSCAPLLSKAPFPIDAMPHMLLAVLPKASAKGSYAGIGQIPYLLCFL